MRANRTYGSEGGEASPSRPLSWWRCASFAADNRQPTTDNRQPTTDNALHAHIRAVKCRCP